MSVGRGRQETSLCDDRGHTDRRISHCRNTQNTHDGRDDSQQHYTDIHSATWVNPRSQTVQQRVKSKAIYRWNNDIEISVHIDERWQTHNRRRPRLCAFYYIYKDKYTRYTILCMKYENVLPQTMKSTSWNYTTSIDNEYNIVHNMKET